MKQRTLGRTGISVGEIGHGLWGLGGWTGTEKDAVASVLDLSVNNGCNFFDSAWAYGAGTSDALLGDMVRRHENKRIVTAGKIPPKGLEFPANPEKSFSEVFPLAHIEKYARESLAKTQLDSFDVMQLHVWDDSWADDPDFAAAVEWIKENGIASHFGISLNRWEPWNGLKAIRTGLVDVVQVIYNIFDQAPEDELLPLCAERNIGVIARVPLDEGSLGGKMTKSTQFPKDDWRSGYFGPENLGPTIDRVDALKEELPIGANLPEVALRFILSNPAVSTVIVGMRQAHHVEANTAASDKGALDPDLLSRLRKHRWDREVTDWAN